MLNTIKTFLFSFSSGTASHSTAKQWPWLSLIHSFHYPTTWIEKPWEEKPTSTSSQACYDRREYGHTHRVWHGRILQLGPFQSPELERGTQYLFRGPSNHNRFPLTPTVNLGYNVQNRSCMYNRREWRNWGSSQNLVCVSTSVSLWS